MLTCVVVFMKNKEVIKTVSVSGYSFTDVMVEAESQTCFTAAEQFDEVRIVRVKE